MTPYSGTYTFNMPYQNAPWLQPAMPTFTPNYNNWGSFTPSLWGWGSVGSSSSGNSSSSSNMTLEEYQEAESKADKEKTKKFLAKASTKKILKNGLSEYTTTYTDPQSGVPVEVYADKDGNALKFKVDSNGQIVLDDKGNPIQDENGSFVPINDQKHISQQKKNLEKSEKSDGSATVSMSADEYEKKVPWWKRTLRAGGNALEGTWKMAKSLVGFDENDKWNPVKCLKNIGIVAAGVALTAVCPAAGPILLYAGLAAGGIQVGKGVYKACTAKTVEEIDNAWQDVGIGVATVLASKGGIKAMGKTANVNMDGLKLVTNAKAVVQSQPKWVFSGGIKGSGSRFVSNLKNLNPFKSESKANLQKAESEYARINTEMNNTALTSAEQDALLQRGIQLEQEIAQLKTVRMNELINSPTKWISKANRKAIRQYTGKGIFKSYWQTNTAGKGFFGKSWFVTKKVVGNGFQLTMPWFILWKPLAGQSFMIPYQAIDMNLYTQHYGEGLFNGFFAPEAVQHMSKEDYEKRLAELTEQEKAIKNQLDALNKPSGTTNA